MPNHIYNRLEVIGTDEQVKQVLEFIKGEPFENGSEMYIDFNKIIEKPKELNIKSDSISTTIQFLLFGTRSGIQEENIEEEQNFIKRFNSKELRKGFNLAIARQANFEKFGYSDWYDWSYANWGTKWNAYTQSLEKNNVVFFNTAWNGVPDLMIKLSLIFPDVTLKYTFEDYYISWNLEIKNGEVVNQQKNEVEWVPVDK
ncbi:hypothetical protein SAMN05444285_106101 [Draconibacterium orientale]|uniref:YubB ferredoxin-like domain-containing protein n=1 Tax=Draconibacterium orientale TaxID=1168034 RepID=X5E1V9_9BACT|nr:hypothetical protein [Draconibacterium orientale]AHW61445.1 hypothetical protein FH5T_01275 [Draconibacterium orientale]SET12709.1 hypothetical protein SAMN05444285_106101 [Draconibacterium orientale]